MVKPVRRWIVMSAMIAIIAAIGISIYVPWNDARVARILEKASKASAADPTIQKIADAIRIVSSQSGAFDPLQAMDSAVTALAAWMDYDVKFGAIATTQEMQRRAAAAGLRVWKGDCKNQAVFISALLRNLGLPHEIKVEHRKFYAIGHAWVHCQLYDLNPGDYSGMVNLPSQSLTNFGKPGEAPFIAEMVILRQPGWEKYALTSERREPVN